MCCTSIKEELFVQLEKIDQEELIKEALTIIVRLPEQFGKFVNREDCEEDQDLAADIDNFLAIEQVQNIICKYDIGN